MKNTVGMIGQITDAMRMELIPFPGGTMSIADIDGRLVSGRPEKGAGVTAAEYLCDAYPDASGFSLRNLRRMREFYRTYVNTPEILAQAMMIGWPQNVVILEAELTLQEREWYIQAVRQFGWPKLGLQQKIASGAHLEIVLDFQNEVCYTEEKSASAS